MEKTMTRTQDYGCQGCTGTPLDFDITMAFQPIANVNARTIFAYEALVRGTDGASAGSISAFTVSAFCCRAVRTSMFLGLCALSRH